MMQLNDSWEKDFVIALRMRDVSGAAIGAAVEEVRAHCAESGEAPSAAFGEPRTYAAALDFRDENRTTPLSARGLVPLLAAVACLWVLPDAVAALGHGADLHLSWGVVLAAGAAVAVGLLAPWILATGMRHPRLLFPVMTVAAFAVVLPALVLRGTATVLDPLLPTVLGTVLLLGSVAVMLVLAWRLPQDDLVAPAEPAAPVGPSAVWSVRLAPLLFLVVCGALTVIAWMHPHS